MLTQGIVKSTIADKNKNLISKQRLNITDYTKFSVEKKISTMRRHVKYEILKKDKLLKKIIKKYVTTQSKPSHSHHVAANK